MGCSNWEMLRIQFLGRWRSVPITGRSFWKLHDNTERMRRTSHMRKLQREEDWRGSETSQISQPTGGGMSLRRKILTAFNHNLIRLQQLSELRKLRSEKSHQFLCGLQINLWPEGEEECNYLLA